MVKEHLNNQNEDSELELDDDSEIKELGNEDLEEETENPNTTDKDDDLKEE